MKNIPGMKTTPFRYIGKVNVEKHCRKEGKNKNENGGAELRQKINKFANEERDEWICQYK